MRKRLLNWSCKWHNSSTTSSSYSTRVVRPLRPHCTQFCYYCQKATGKDIHTDTRSVRTSSNKPTSQRLGDGRQPEKMKRRFFFLDEREICRLFFFFSYWRYIIDQIAFHSIPCHRPNFSLPPTLLIFFQIYYYYDFWNFVFPLYFY